MIGVSSIAWLWKHGRIIGLLLAALFCGLWLREMVPEEPAATVEPRTVQAPPVFFDKALAYLGFRDKVNKHADQAALLFYNQRKCEGMAPRPAGCTDEIAEALKDFLSTRMQCDAKLREVSKRMEGARK